jgi:hypothetical protein
MCFIMKGTWVSEKQGQGQDGDAELDPHPHRIGLGPPDHLVGDRGEGK